MHSLHWQETRVWKMLFCFQSSSFFLLEQPIDVMLQGYDLQLKHHNNHLVFQVALHCGFQLLSDQPLDSGSTSSTQTCSLTWIDNVIHVWSIIKLYQPFSQQCGALVFVVVRGLLAAQLKKVHYVVWPRILKVSW